MPYRRNHLAVRIAVVLAVTAPLFYFSRSPGEGGPLNLGTYTSTVSIEVDVGGTLTYGNAIIANDGNADIVIDEAELLTHDDGATVIEARVLAVNAVPNGSLIGEAFGPNFPDPAMPIPGATVEPSQGDPLNSYQLQFYIIVERPTLFEGIRVRYRVGDRTYVETASYRLKICTPRGPRCPLPPRITPQ
jgi:hypothetical protein